MIRNLILDWSGTLVDDLPVVWRATNYVFEQVGLAQMSLDQFRAEFCLPYQAFYQRYTPQVPVVQLEQWFHRFYLEARDEVVELPHARGFLEFARDCELRTLVLTAVTEDHFTAQAERLGFSGFIDRVYAGVADKRELICSVLEENKIDPRQTLYVGDMEHDMAAARRGGVWSCAVLTGYNRLEQLRASNPDLIVEHLGELVTWLQGHRLKWPEPPGQPAVAMPVVTVGALIFNSRGEVLMIRTHKWSDLWGIPGGKIRYGETSAEALCRELKEETNLDVSDIRFVLAQDCIDSEEFYRPAHFVLLNYTCCCAGRGEVRLNEEAQTYQWLEPRRALSLPLNSPTRVLLEEVLASERTPSFFKSVPSAGLS